MFFLFVLCFSYIQTYKLYEIGIKDFLSVLKVVCSFLIVYEASSYM